MKKSSILILLMSFLSFSCANQTSTMEQEAVLRHVVSFKFTADTTEDQLQEIVDAFAALPDQIEGIQSFEWGTNNSPEGLNKEMTHCFVLGFSSEADRDAYLPHPAHQAFVDLAGPHIEDVFVIDYWAN